ncbi:adenosylmethionine--8-amino-7-oxononanoate transaminase [Pseudochrobactrum sp. Wa41.01b-1]|uniref:adenosylmethionine--8-amino-7-oxononanoate transaminase n=1 Tax=Pseudochrobactrum sp. Wa41.01b-1 TaxID=2864102 RepID=UPI001C692283|nr:adenosylmethionine--8-amino-7-oxononanoate transaminase [Pseudochrobactrum sp. Wa41.01b-1]QYM72288.1 adenosylmethionine--8-amino-7-oxononanoate transaminase [Pseudochrobactrum sp. Wa41.01b-1]
MNQHSSPVWHPFTQHLLEPVTKKIARTEGAYLIDEDGRKILDLISSWWVITHGHRTPKIMQAIREATEQYDQIIFAEYSHEPAEQLAQELIRIAPHGLSHVFYSDSGSTSVEVALKMALGYFHNRGEPRSRIAVMAGSYHGDTIGTMSAGERGVFNAAYGALLYDVVTIPFPAEGREQQTLDAFEQLCRDGDLAALIVEPLVLGAGGMKIYPAFVLRQLKAIAEAHGVLLICDEVMTGWGRTGTLFASEQAGITPDILCLSKGITGGALPLAVTLCVPEIFEAHLSTDRSRTFYHSSSYTANPIACAAGLANVQIWRDEPVLQRVQTLQAMQSRELVRFKNDPRFENVRQCGTITALDVKAQNSGYLSDVALRLKAFFRSHDVLLRPLGNVLYLMPPYCVTEQELQRSYLLIDEAAALLQSGKL